MNDTKKDTKSLSVQAKYLFENYFSKDIPDDFSKIPEYVKLALLQRLPRAFVRSRKVASVSIPYIPHQIAEKALNFVFNFQVSTIVEKEEYREYREGGKNIIEAEVRVKFIFNGEIIRTVYSSHKGYPNKATNRGDIMKAAYSKAWTVVARTFGIGSNLTQRENKAYNQVAKQEIKKPTKTVVINHIEKLKAYLKKNGYDTIEKAEKMLKDKFEKQIKLNSITQADAKTLLLTLLNYGN